MLVNLSIRFMSHVEKSRSGCWRWTGLIDKYGYGHTSVGSRSDGTRRGMLAHRLAYERAHGVELAPRGHPDHRQVDHVCHNRSKSCKGGVACLHRRCVNPAHLVLTTAQENTAASSHSTASINRAKTHCSVCGNDLNGPNVYRIGKSRKCKPCAVRRATASKRRLRAS
jgi:hypothetical protein